MNSDWIDPDVRYGGLYYWTTVCWLFMLVFIPMFFLDYDDAIVDWVCRISNFYLCQKYEVLPLIYQKGRSGSAGQSLCLTRPMRWQA